MDPNSGELVIATPKDVEKAEKKLGRPLKPGDKVGKKVTISKEAYDKLKADARAAEKWNREQLKGKRRGHTRRKRTEARNRAKKGKH